MAIELLPLTPERLDDLESLLLPVWNRRWHAHEAERIFRWRFLERPGGEAIIAYEGQRPVGFIDSFFRRYRTRSGTVRVREPADWYCEPDHRPFLSVKLIRRLMHQPEPVLVVGGNATGRRILAKLGWKELPEVTSYGLLTGTGAMVKALSETLRFPLSAVPRALARPLSLRTRWSRRRGPPPGRPAVVSHRVGPEAPVPEPAPGNGTYGLAPVVDRQEWDWFRKAPDRMGEFVWFTFEIGEVRGVSFTRVYEEGPFRAARVLHIDASEPSVEIYSSIIDETVRMLMPARPQWVTARFNSPLALKALESLGFRELVSSRTFWWHRELPPPDEPVHLGWNTGDEGLLPYPM